MDKLSDAEEEVEWEKFGEKFINAGMDVRKKIIKFCISEKIPASYLTCIVLIHLGIEHLMDQGVQSEHIHQTVQNAIDSCKEKGN